ncbi:MAG TPA: DUF3322 domain-containing protein [Burkholderiaceae bacterium]|nr:DUF3322 domain-containing protein [Burkholderiaceae bacterium]
MPGPAGEAGPRWSTPEDLHAQVQRLWERGRLLAERVAASDLFPLKLALKAPASADWSERFDAVRAWARGLQQAEGYRLVLREVRHRVLGRNVVPGEVWVDTLDAALALLGQQRAAQRFDALVAQARDRQPALLPWLQAQPLRALDLADDWPRLLDVVGWLQAHPRPGLYLRQVDLPGIHSKFIEAHRGVLAELLDRALPAEAIDAGSSRFESRYGWRSKPVRVRLRLLDARQALLPTGTEQDLTLTQDTFARWEPAASRVFITENETNFLCFPALDDALVIFGAGYGFEMLAQAAWLQRRRVGYWGDIDTHGFAILDQLRSVLPHAESVLMDRATLMAHRAQWVDEPEPVQRDLPRLTPAEQALYDELRWQRIEPRALRLEQERLGFGWASATLAR